MSRVRRLALLMFALFASAILVAPLASAAPPWSAKIRLDQIDKYLVYIKMQASGYVMYEDASGRSVISKQLTTDLGACTGGWISREADILTAAHCTNAASARQALTYKFQMGDMDENDPRAIFGIPENDFMIISIFGSEGPGSNPDILVEVSQMDVPGAVLDDPVPAQLVKSMSMSEGDFALLHVTGLSKPTPALPVAFKMPKIGSDAVAVGYSGEVSEFQKENPLRRASLKFGKVSALQPLNGYGWPSNEIDAVMTHGMSGGPVMSFNDDTDMPIAVIGTVSHGLFEGDNYSTDTVSMRKFLQMHQVAFRTVK